MMDNRLMGKLHNIAKKMQSKRIELKKLMHEIDCLTADAIDIIVDYEGKDEAGGEGE